MENFTSRMLVLFSSLLISQIRLTSIHCQVKQKFHFNGVGLFLTLTDFSAPADQHGRTLIENSKYAIALIHFK